MPLEIRRDDIREIAVDCILNPTDEELSGGGGTDYCIHQAAGPRLRTECDQYSGLKTAEVVVTKAYDMKNCDYILHTVGPIYYKSNASADEDLRRTYENALNKARELGLSSIAMPLVSTGTFGFPKKKALNIATKVISDFLYDNEMDVYLLVYDKEAFEISKTLYRNIDDYLSNYGFSLDDDYSEINEFDSERVEKPRFEMPSFGRKNAILPNAINDADYCLEDIEPFIDDYVEDESFNECLRRMIIEKDLLEKDVYKNANLSKQAFNKIYNNNVIPKKSNVLALAIGLKLNENEAIDFIEKAGYSFGHNKRDYIVRYFLKNRSYKIYEINRLLFEYDLEMLGSRME